jgi:uncharacterized protein (TIGR03067 family)
MGFRTLCCAAVTAVAMGCTEASQLSSDFTAWNGKWTEVAYLHDGATPPPEHFVELVTTFDGSKLVRESHGQVVNEGKLTVAVDQTPMQFDGVGKGPDGSDSPYKEIFHLQGDRLVLCFDPTGQKRPQKFQSSDGSGFVLVTLERVR